MTVLLSTSPAEGTCLVSNPTQWLIPLFLKNPDDPKDVTSPRSPLRPLISRRPKTAINQAPLHRIVPRRLVHPSSFPPDELPSEIIFHEFNLCLSSLLPPYSCNVMALPVDILTTLVFDRGRLTIV